MLVNILSYPISDMNYKIRLFLITSLFALAKCQDTPGMVIKGDDNVDCYNYGIKDNCELPFGKDNGKIIKCEKACVKFDGYAKDGERIVVRNCGYFTGDECLDGIYYEDEDQGVNFIMTAYKESDQIDFSGLLDEDTLGSCEDLSLPSE